MDKELLERVAREVQKIFCAVQPASWRLVIRFPRSSGKRMSRIYRWLDKHYGLALSGRIAKELKHIYWAGT